jgi:hypothetical protein
MGEDRAVLGCRLFREEERSRVGEGHDGKWILQEEDPRIRKVQVVQLYQEDDRAGDKQCFKQVEGEVDKPVGGRGHPLNELHVRQFTLLLVAHESNG